MRTLIVDDEPSARNGIKRILNNHPLIELVGEAHSANQLQSSIREHKPDLVLLDIMLRDNNSLDLLKTQQELPLIIITTAYDNYALKGFNLRAVDYLMKPISKQKLYAAIDRAFTLFSSKIESSDHLLIKSEGRYIRLKRDDILFVKGLQNYVLIHTENKKVVCKTTMKEISRDLKSQYFLRVHRSYIVNTKKIDSFEKQTIYLNEYELPIGKTLKKDTYHFLLNQ